MKTKEEIKNKIAIENNFDSFERAIRYTFNRKLLQSEEDFINKIIDEAMEEHGKREYNLAVMDSAIAMQIYGDIVDEKILLNLLKP